MKLKSGVHTFRGICEYDHGRDEYGDDIDGYYVFIDDEVYDFRYDASDGYRSYCEIDTIPKPEDVTFNFEDNPIEVYIDVDCENIKDDYGYTRKFDGIRMYDLDGQHVLATLGTDDADDYYPSCIMEVNIPLINEIYFHHLVGVYQ